MKPDEGGVTAEIDQKRWVSMQRFVTFEVPGTVLTGSYLGAHQKEGSSQNGEAYILKHVLLPDDGTGAVVFNHSHGLDPLLSLPFGQDVRIEFVGEAPFGKARVKEFNIQIKEDDLAEIVQAMRERAEFEKSRRNAASIAAAARPTALPAAPTASNE